MKVVIDRTHCDLCQSYCDRHVAKFIRFPEHEDRPCIKSFEDDRDGQKLSGRGVYPGLDESSWTERLLTQQEEPRLSEYFFSLVGDYYARYNSRSKLTRDISPVRQMNELVIKRYRPDGQEQGVGRVAEEAAG